jgi:FkbM family methyltransferase
VQPGTGNPEPFLRLGLLLFLNATRKNQPPPQKAREALLRAHELMDNKRTALALELLENENRLEELVVPYEDFSVSVYPDIKNLSTFVLLEQGDWFEDIIHLFRSLIKPGDNVLDLGTNIGVYSLSAARRVTDTGRIISVEPCKKTFSFLQKSAGQFKNMLPLNCAVSNVCGTGILENAGEPELNRLLENGGTGETVTITTVDDIAAREGIDHFDIIKMDVEGFEAQVIEGAQKTLANTDPIVFFEVSETGLGLVNSFQKMGFDSYYYCAPRNTLMRYKKGDVFDSFLLNLIAMRKNSLDRFTGLASIE